MNLGQDTMRELREIELNKEQRCVWLVEYMLTDDVAHYHGTCGVSTMANFPLGDMSVFCIKCGKRIITTEDNT